MLTVVIPEAEGFDERNSMFIYYKEQKLTLEHSLVSIAKWESKWNRPFLNTEKSSEETIDYIRCMTLTQNVPDDVYYRIPPDVIDKITKYIDAPMTATTFSDFDNDDRRRNREVVTSELIYYWMIAEQVPFECQKWHINRLLTLLRVCSIKNAPPKKMGKNKIAKKYAELNEMRKRKFNTRG